MNSLINNNGAQCARISSNQDSRLPTIAAAPSNNGSPIVHAPVLLTPIVLSDRPTCVTAGRLLLDETIRTPEELIPGLLHMGTKGMLVGASKCGKTWLLMDLAISVATGTPFLRWECNAGKVLYVNFEIAKPFFRTRLDTMLRARNLPNPENLHTLHLRGTSISFAELAQEIIINSRVERYALIILDPIYKATGSKSDGASGAVAKICAQLDAITNQTGAVVLFAHHFNKGKSHNQPLIDRMSGSGTWSRDLDTIISVTQHAQLPAKFVIETKLRNYETFPPFVIHREGATIEVRDDIDPPVLDDNADANDRGLLQLLGTERLSTIDFRSRAVANNIPRSTFYRVLRVLQRTGRIYLDALAQTWARTQPPRLNTAAEPPQVFEHANRILWLEDNAGNDSNPPNGEIPKNPTPNETRSLHETNENSKTDGNTGTNNPVPPI